MPIGMGLDTSAKHRHVHRTKSIQPLNIFSATVDPPFAIR